MKNRPPDPAAPPSWRCRMAMPTALLLSLAACAHAHTAESPAVEAGQADSPAISPWVEPEPDTSIEEDPAYPQVAAER